MLVKSSGFTVFHIIFFFINRAIYKWDLEVYCMSSVRTISKCSLFPEFNYPS